MLYHISQGCCLHVDCMVVTKLCCCNNYTSLHKWGFNVLSFSLCDSQREQFVWWRNFCIPVPTLFSFTECQETKCNCMSLGELYTFGKELARPLVAFYSEWKYFFYPKEERSFDQGTYFPNNLSLRIVFLFLGLSNKLLEYCTKYKPIYKIKL